MKFRNCKNLIIKKDNRIISHAGIYADTDDISVIGGVITHNKYKGLGYGKQNWIKITTCAKLEKIK